MRGEYYASVKGGEEWLYITDQVENVNMDVNVEKGSLQDGKGGPVRVYLKEEVTQYNYKHDRLGSLLSVSPPVVFIPQ